MFDNFSFNMGRRVKQKVPMFWDFVHLRDGSFIGTMPGQKSGEIGVVFLPTGMSPSPKNYVLIPGVPEKGLSPPISATPLGLMRSEWAGGLRVLYEDNTGVSTLMKFLCLNSESIASENAKLKRQVEVLEAQLQVLQAGKAATDQQIVKTAVETSNIVKKQNERDETGAGRF